MILQCSRPFNMAEIVIIKELVDNLFPVRPLHYLFKIVNKGRPTLPIPNLITHYKTKTERCTRHFGISQYEKDDWLVGYETGNKFRWPCLFFLLLKNMKGFSDLNLLSSAQQTYSKS
jgi:hypothetical protein